MHASLTPLLILLTASVLAVSLARRFRLPSILAYLSLGILFGPHSLAVLKDSPQSESIAEFGIVFLMFSIGLEFSLPRLRSMRNLVFGYGSAQLLLTALGTMVVTSLAYEQGWKAGLAVGLAIAMSSTAIVAKLLSERLELHSRSGRQTMGVLLFQDLAVVPCLILIPALASSGGELAKSLGIALAQAIALLALMIWLGQKLMGRLLDRIASRQSEELFVLATMWIVVGLAWLTGRTGLSLALGAFVGGMLISETAYRHHIEADIRPFRDMLLGFFFVTVGMMLDIRFVMSHLHMLALAVFLVIVGKGTVMLLVTLATRTPLSSGLRTAAQIAQGGEFGLVLIELAFDHGVIGTDVFQITLSAMLISMFLAPLLIAKAARLSGELGQGKWAHRPTAIHEIATQAGDLSNHVIIGGHGRTGNRIGECLQHEGIAYLALDIDPQRIARARSRGAKVAFGSAERPEVLQAAGIARARAVVLTYPDVLSTQRAMLAVRRVRPDIPLIVRTPNESDVPRLRELGATEVVSEVLEGGLLMATETLTHIGVPLDRTLAHIDQIRSSRIAMLNEVYTKKIKKERRKKPRFADEGGRP